MNCGGFQTPVGEYVYPYQVINVQVEYLTTITERERPYIRPSPGRIPPPPRIVGYEYALRLNTYIHDNSFSGKAVPPFGCTFRSDDYTEYILLIPNEIRFVDDNKFESYFIVQLVNSGWFDCMYVKARVNGDMSEIQSREWMSNQVQFYVEVPGD